MALTQVVRLASKTGSRGDIVTYTGSDVAANTEWSETVPAGKMWRIQSIRNTLVTDANVANRRVCVTITDGTNVVFKTQSSSVQAASLTHAYNVTPIVGKDAADLEHVVPLPLTESFVLPAGYVIASSTLNKQATDNWGVPYFLVEEFSA